MSNPNDTVASLNSLGAEMSLLKHPFYQQWTAGTLSAQRLGNYAIQYYRRRDPASARDDLRAPR